MTWVMFRWEHQLKMRTNHTIYIITGHVQMRTLIKMRTRSNLNSWFYNIFFNLPRTIHFPLSHPTLSHPSNNTHLHTHTLHTTHTHCNTTHRLLAGTTIVGTTRSKTQNSKNRNNKYKKKTSLFLSVSSFSTHHHQFSLPAPPSPTSLILLKKHH